MNFYTWIRESVKRAVLLGLSDAVEQIGPDMDGDASRQKLLAMLGNASLPAGQTLEAKATEPGTTGRRRLGRSLDQIQQGQARGATS